MRNPCKAAALVDLLLLLLLFTKKNTTFCDCEF